MTESATYEHHFVTDDGPIFQMIEDERGDIFWGYGHREGPEFIDEVNHWLIHVNAAMVPEDLIPLTQHVDHLWAKYDVESPDGSDHFKLVEDFGNDLLKKHADIFPVTRLVI
jgi:hypothetical protein